MPAPLTEEELKRIAAGKKAIGRYALRVFADLASDPEGKTQREIAADLASDPEGKTQREIAAEVGCGVMTVGDAVRKRTLSEIAQPTPQVEPEPQPTPETEPEHEVMPTERGACNSPPDGLSLKTQGRSAPTLRPHFPPTDL